MDDFSDREMYEQAAANVVALIVAADAFLSSRGIDPTAFYRFFGESYADEWRDADEIGKAAHDVALNVTSGGLETTSTVDRDTAVIRAAWTKQHDDGTWPTPVKPALEAALPALFEAPMAAAGMAMKTAASVDGVEIHIARM
jgi:2,4-dienoyl-CoA reductase-like NADH-dependent reductase (Old Yellow Enzyme family)